jgi:pyruvate/2-oxoglutarate dehydrogenase complex dihydrolipoamide dehydrogenase (E3) component
MSAPPAIEPADSHDQTLLANVRPAGWTNPTPASRYNLVVIGAGTAGLVSAIGAAGLGARVALVERHLMGGDCLNVGCVPSKALLRAARAVADVRGAGCFGVEVAGPVRADFGQVMEYVRRLRASMSPADSARRYRDLGVDIFFGDATFAGPDAVRVNEHTLRFSKAVIATGARPALPPIPGIGDSGYLTNETVFSLASLPGRLVVVGGGPIGCELAQAFARLGSRVTLVESAARLLGRDDPDASAVVERALARDGVRVVLGATVERVERAGDERMVHVAAAGGHTHALADNVLVAVGRVPRVEALGLDAAGVAYDLGSGIRVDDRLRTTNPRIYAAGDVCSPRRFTHHADFQARTVIRNALFLGRARASALIVPRCTYTDPEVAHVGLTADEAAAQGVPVRTFVQDLAEVDRAALDGETEGFVKVHVREGSDRILGATIVARHAGEMLPELTLAMARGIGLGALASVIHTYPTQAEAIRRLGDAYNRTRLSPRVRRVLEMWLKWTRR